MKFEYGTLVKWYCHGRTEERPVPVSFNTPQIPYILAWNRKRVSVVTGRRLTIWDKERPKLSKGLIKWQVSSKLEAMSGNSSAHGKLRARKWPRIIDGSEQTCFTISNNMHAIRGTPYPEQSWWAFRKCGECHGELLRVVYRKTKQVKTNTSKHYGEQFLSICLLAGRKVMICTVYLLWNVWSVWPIYLNGQCRPSFTNIYQHKQTANQTKL